MRERLFKISKHQQFVDLATEFFGKPMTRVVRKPEDVWFKVSKYKRVYVELYYRNFYREEVYDGIRLMVFVTTKIVIKQIGKYELPYEMIVYGVNIPAPGSYIHEKSPLYRLLKDLQLMAKKIG